MSETDFAARLAAVERAVTDDGTDLTDVREDADLTASVEDLESRVADLEATVDELDAALQAVRGYAGNVRAVNRDVERRASAAIAKAEALEASVDGNAEGPRSHPDQYDRRRTPQTTTAGRDSSIVVGRDARRDETRDAATTVEDHAGTGNTDAAGSRERADGEAGSRHEAEGRTTQHGHEGRAARHEDAGRTARHVAVGRARDEGRSTDGQRTDRKSEGPNGGSGSPTERFVERVRDAL